MLDLHYGIRTQIPKPYQYAEDKMYAMGNLVGAAVIGGLFGVVYMVYKNYVAVGDTEKAAATLRYGLVGAVVVYLAVINLVPDGTSIGVALGGCGWSLNSIRYRTHN